MSKKLLSLLTAVLFNTAFAFSTEVILQNGLDGYAGCKDSYITEGSKEANYGDENTLIIEGIG